VGRREIAWPNLEYIGSGASPAIDTDGWAARGMPSRVAALRERSRGLDSISRRSDERPGALALGRYVGFRWA